MIPLKSCYVLLNRNFLDLGKPNKMINYFPKVDPTIEKSYQSNIVDCITTSSKFTSDKSRNEKQVNYSDHYENEDSEVSSDETSDSEFSSDSNSSDDDEMTPKKQKRKKDLSKTNAKDLSCLLCNESFSTHSSYLRHKRSHKSNPYKCIICRKAHKNRQSYLNHMKKLHPEVEPFLCEYSGCDQSFRTQKLMEIHHKTHWRYMCKYCKKLYARKHHMTKHVLQIH